MTRRSAAVKRVNARLDREAAKRLAAIAKREGRSVSDVLRSALQRYCNDAESKDVSVLEKFERLGFVGCGSSNGKRPADDKQELLEYIERKHGYR
jgi:predicted DNA-binding protein